MAELVTLVVAKDIVPGLIEDMKYATADNFMKRQLYDDPTCYTLDDTALKPAIAQSKLSERKPGFHLKVLDCYRPMYVQQEMWREYTNTPYVANPKTARHPARTGGGHNHRGRIRQVSSKCPLHTTISRQRRVEMLRQPRREPPTANCFVQ